MLVCRAPTYPPKIGPTPKMLLPLRIFFFSYSVNKPFFKIIKSCFLIKETVTETVITVKSQLSERRLSVPTGLFEDDGQSRLFSYYLLQ